MKRVFLSSGIKTEKEKYARKCISKILNYNNLDHITVGINVASLDKGITEKIKDMMKDVDGFVTVVVTRENKKISDYISNEYALASQLNLPRLIFKEKNVILPPFIKDENLSYITVDFNNLETIFMNPMVDNAIDQFKNILEKSDFYINGIINSNLPKLDDLRIYFEKKDPLMKVSMAESNYRFSIIKRNLTKLEKKNINNSFDTEYLIIGQIRQDEMKIIRELYQEWKNMGTTNDINNNKFKFGLRRKNENIINLNAIFTSKPSYKPIEGKCEFQLLVQEYEQE